MPRRDRARRPAAAAWVAWAALSLLPAAAVAAERSAQMAQPAQPAPVAAPSSAVAPEPKRGADDAVVHRLGQKLRCPVCQGMAIGDSPAPMAQDMMRQVRRLRGEGLSEDAIANYFTARYGTWVLLDPPKEGAGLWVWLLPPVALVAGVAYALVSLRRRQARGHTKASTASTAPAAATPGAPTPAVGTIPHDLLAIRDEAD